MRRSWWLTRPITGTIHLPMRGRRMLQTQSGFFLPFWLLQCAASPKSASRRLQDGRIVSRFTDPCQRCRPNAKCVDTAVLALIGLIIWTTLDFVAAFKYGAGRHSWDLPPVWYNGYLTVRGSEQKNMSNEITESILRRVPSAATFTL